MIHVNENYAKLQASYLFAEIAHRIKAYEAEKPPRPIIFNRNLEAIACRPA